MILRLVLLEFFFINMDETQSLNKNFKKFNSFLFLTLSLFLTLHFSRSSAYGVEVVPEDFLCCSVVDDVVDLRLTLPPLPRTSVSSVCIVSAGGLSS